MNKTNINYPHPVLSALNEDYINSKFDIELIDEPMVEGDKAIITVGYDLECTGLEELVKQGKAKVVIYLESVVAEYRHIEAFPAETDVLEIIINKENLNKEVLLKGYIMAAGDITSFSLVEHNKESFGSVPFFLRKGDIMAIATHHYNIPLQSYDPLADRPSIFSIRRQTEHPKEEIIVDFSDQKITIFLNDATYEKYQTLYEAPDVRGVLTSIFATPVLVDVLYYIRTMDEDTKVAVEGKKWYQVIMHRISEMKIDLSKEDSLTKVANAILPHIFASSIDSLTELCKTMLKEGGKDEN